MGKKKFIDKKKAATFQLFARDSLEIGQSEGADSDHVFVRVDNNPVRIDGFHESHGDDSNFDSLADDPDSMFADAPEDALPDHVRREILELGFPDDGYDYLSHMREIRDTGGGTAYYPNPKSKRTQIPLDVKAYDASNVRVEGANVEVNVEKIMYSVAEKSLKVGVQSAVDPDVIALLDADDSQLGSDVEDLEEDFVVQANLPEEAGSSSAEKNFSLDDQSENHMFDEPSCLYMNQDTDDAGDCPYEGKDRIDEKPRANRLLDQ